MLLMPAPTIEELAALAFQKFKTLPKTGKPTAKEWTVLSAILQHNSATAVSKVVALGCGTKCIGKSKLCHKGLILNDSHAEVLARRAFLRYLYRQMRKASPLVLDDDSIFDWDAAKLLYRLRPDISFHFVSTQTPCGDACIKNSETVSSDEDKMEIKSKKRKLAHAVEEPMETETVYTGAKLIGDHEDAMQQTLGAPRTKPGRGERTLSMSCSDKLSRWTVLGVQGALIDALLQEPIYLQTLNFCCASDRPCIERAIYGRWSQCKFENSRFQIHIPDIRINTDLMFECSQQPERTQPSSNGLNWCDIENYVLCKPYEISVNGKRQGVTKKDLKTPKAALDISKYGLLKNFVRFLKEQQELIEKFQLQSRELERIEYLEYKRLATDYQSAWLQLKENYFQQWTQKPQDLLRFCLAAAEEIQIN